MGLFQLIIILIVIGVMLRLVDKYVPMQATMKRIFIGVVVIAVVIWLLRILFANTGIHDVKI